MSKFNIGDKIVRISDFNKATPEGYITYVMKGDKYIAKDYSVKFIHDFLWELVPQDIKTKWSIYNNTLPWSELSDKQKGKLLLGRHQGLDFTIDGLGFKSVSFDCVFYVYKAIKPEPVKPEPTMEELFDADSESFDFRGSGDFPEYMIAKGWTKTCK
jgi:hypothetical protein